MNNEKKEHIKKILMSEQQFNKISDQLINDILDGKAKLLSAKEICERLNISENYFTNLVKVNDPTYKLQESNASLGETLLNDVLKGFLREETSEENLQYGFPKPDIYIAGKARWATQTLKSWLLEGAK